MVKEEGKKGDVLQIIRFVRFRLFDMTSSQRKTAR
jgi:hypothetical protein